MEENKTETASAPENDAKETRALKGYIYKRVIAGILLVFAILWIAGALLGFFDSSSPEGTAAVVVGGEGSQASPDHGSTPPGETVAPGHASPAAGGGDLQHAAGDKGAHPTTDAHAAAPAVAAGGHQAAEARPPAVDGAGAHSAAAQQASTASREESGSGTGSAPSSHGASSDAHTAQTSAGASEGAAGHPEPKGVAFMNATIKPLYYELSERWYGWRPNDIFDFTDNVNNYQLGVLEVTRRTVVALAERLSRTGSTASFDKNLESAMNWLMIKAASYWFPTPESKYRASLDELRIYREKLWKGEARFYTRTDNLIPLLMAFEDLLGSCDENLVKQMEDDGASVSFFTADDYFYYAKGVASAMYVILEAVHEDFGETVEGRRGSEVLHHAIESCRQAMEIDPIIILNSGWSGIFANHRANMAAPISHARFYIGLLIKTLST